MILSLALSLFQAQLSPQQLIDIAPPGSVVVLPRVDPGVASNYFPRWSLRIDKPLTVFGNGTRTRNIFLEGPGAGEVVLRDLFVEHVHWCVADCMDTYEWAPHGQHEGSIMASGFDSVKLYDCSVDGRLEVLDAELVLLAGGGYLCWDDWAAVTTPGAQLVLVGALPEHGRAAAPGVGDAAEVLYTDGRVPFQCASHIPTAQLGEELTMTGSGKIGSGLHLEWPTYGVLWVSQGVGQPTLTPHGAWRFLGENPRFVKLGRRANVPIPARRDLIGLQLTFQATDFGVGYSSPAFVLIRP